jgi:serine/threonine protein kinase
MRSFSHPNILRLIEVLHLPSTDDVYLVLEYAANGCLGAFLDRGQQLCVHSILSILKQLLSALKCLHQAGIVHQDIKPWNILIDGQGRAILADFGIGHSFGSASMVVGSPAYCAPEAFDDDEDCDRLPEKEDIWALGVTLYQLLFGRLPFVGESMYEIVNVIKEEGVQIPEEADQEISEILAGMLTVDPSERWGIDELLEHPVVAGASDRASELPPVPLPRMRQGEVREIRANVCPRDFSFSDALLLTCRRASFGGVDGHRGPGLLRTKSAPPEAVPEYRD